jgi:predicted nucleic acid-binding protein
MYLVDTNIISEARKGAMANAGVKAFFRDAIRDGAELYVSAITIGEMRRGVDILHHRGDAEQARQIEQWLAEVVDGYADNIISFDADMAQVWGRLRVPNKEHELDKQIAATALLNDLVVVTRNTKDFAATGVKLLNPFT